MFFSYSTPPHSKSSYPQPNPTHADGRVADVGVEAVVLRGHPEYADAGAVFVEEARCPLRREAFVPPMHFPILERQDRDARWWSGRRRDSPKLLDSAQHLRHPGSFRVDPDAFPAACVEELPRSRGFAGEGTRPMCALKF